MTYTKITSALIAALALSACAYDPPVIGSDKRSDTGTGAKDLSQLVPGIWVDPNGCDHWIIDDGTEGYLSARLDDLGRPVCSGVAEPTFTVGDFKGGSLLTDPN